MKIHFPNKNNTSTQFFRGFFLIKDLNSRAALLWGMNKGETDEWSPLMPKSRSPLQALVGVVDSSNLWHPTHRTFLQSLCSSSITMSLNPFVCTFCHCNKSHKLPFGISSLGIVNVFLNSFIMMFGVLLVIIYWWFFILCYLCWSLYICLYPIKRKSYVFSICTTFKALVENYFHTKIITFCSDGGGEFIKLKIFLAINVITHLTTPPHTPEHNGVAKRHHRHVVETG